MKQKTVQQICIWLFLLTGSWSAGTGILIYKLPNLIMNKLSRLQIERAGALDKWVHKRAAVDHTFRDVVRPNVDTIYSSIFADLSRGPYVLEAPPIDKYWSFGFYADNTTNFNILSIRTHGTEKPVRAILVPKGYSGDTRGLETVEAPSDLVWIIARFRIEGKYDEPRIHAIQDRIRFLPLSEYGTI
ncbi:MAG: DUF1254 domain-containing protein [Desulfobacterales bacterium]|nr:DUF1254 domain-containing protein [Desulfobacterales bacterium]